MINFVINDRRISVEKQTSVLEAARANGVDIPALCFHPALRPSGSCKLCVVEIIGHPDMANIPTTMLSCILKVKDGIVITTESDQVQEARIKAFRNLLQMAPQSKPIRQMAERYNVPLGPAPDGCIRCRLCVRICKDIVGAGALKMEKRNGTHYVVPVEGRCIGCGTCANICPTGAIKVEDQDNMRIISIRDEIIVRHPLATCEACGKRFATTKFLAYIEQRTEPHPHTKEEHRYCPTCAKLFSNQIKTFSRPAKR
ncbi:MULTISPECIES: 2Fe-2S iron-sulfur cluster-binding protein [Desulfococcus]|jgi:NADH dehydrogenase/NADH:ubiquinone oxidoreductase subunit G|uniref:4Fe-4S ferredoxin iron-sulfur binding domain-containing protein n=1 Tax=Desulfococcus multivorans DSM 2059 TaxID=1121405 RepID=S7U1T1_DESML|nr:2Fe-2S iron-sulfur cluster-binding protein [Desulfococcus multivorans]AOY58850.1 2Fe-2S and 4Fe-4S ferredoxin iron-sulfur protein [Desulfococcus multivorans]AQV02981.1 2Fe-2S ferredoxin [Desulfococcus multivorans]EPR42975.1 4Fe-4S ferredoxin iron-sulfur binding domain-containing protein [Desulfococcus multivorans DSM 2059]MDX9817887.1 2Fe-2S iron-sulfur cluster-binding protein [Desulfococcus multivorans]SJZ51686.1 4Fe-4S dicluster domain-containing protein [Desulfococcus multivorans DSM 205